MFKSNFIFSPRFWTKKSLYKILEMFFPIIPHLGSLYLILYYFILFFFLNEFKEKSCILPIHLLKLGSHFPRCFYSCANITSLFSKSQAFFWKFFPHKLSEISLILESTLTSFSNLKIRRNLPWFFHHKKLWKMAFVYTQKLTSFVFNF